MLPLLHFPAWELLGVLQGLNANHGCGFLRPYHCLYREAHWAGSLSVRQN